MSRILDNKVIKIIIVTILSFVMVICGRISVEYGKITLAVVIVAITGWGIFVIGRKEFISKFQRGSLNKLEDYRLAKRHQRNNIGKMYKNIILFTIPIIILSWTSVNKYVINKEYTKRMNNNFDVAVEQLKADDDGLGEYFNTLTKDPILSMIVEEGNTKDYIIIGSVLITTAKNVGVTFSALHIAGQIVSDVDTITEEDRIKLIQQIKDANTQTDKVSNSLIYQEDSKYILDEFLISMADVNNKFTDLSSKVIDGLENNTIDNETYSKMRAEFSQNIGGDVGLAIESLKSTTKIINNQMIIGALTFRLLWITAIWSIFRLVGIIKYFIELKRYQRNYIPKV